MTKAAIKSALGGLAYLKARLLFGNSIAPGAKLSLSSDVRYSILRGSNEVGKRSVVHRSTLGEYSYLGDDCRIINVEIGIFSALGCGIKTSFGSHPHHYLSQHPATYSVVSGMPSFAKTQLYDTEHALTPDGKFVSIGHDVWIGHGAIIMPGLKIGHGAVVAAGAVVTKDVAPHAIVAGVPAQFLRWRFPPEISTRIIALSWWDWEHDRLATAVEDMRSLSVAAFLEKYG